MLADNLISGDAFTRSLVGKLGPQGGRRYLFAPGRAAGNVGKSGAIYMEDSAALGRLPALAEVANSAVFVVPEGASAMTRTVINLTYGSTMN